jgi:hypothetical protein
LLLSRGVEVRLRVPYRDALVAYARLLVAGSITPPELVVASHGQLFLPLEDIGHLELQDSLYDVLEESEGRLSESFFAIFGAEVSTERVVGKEGFVRKVFSAIVKEKNKAGLQWVLEVINTRSVAITKQMKNELWPNFVERVVEERKQALPGDVVYNLLGEIQEAVGVKTLENGTDKVFEE